MELQYFDAFYYGLEVCVRSNNCVCVLISMCYVGHIVLYAGCFVCLCVLYDTYDCLTQLPIHYCSVSGGQF